MYIVFGDLHGHYSEFRKLLEEVESAVDPQPDDTFIFLGDYVDGGPQTRELVDFLMEFEQQHKCVFLLGNHEHMLLEAVAYRGDMRTWNHWFFQGGKETLSSYLPEGLSSLEQGMALNGSLIPERHRFWMRSLRPFYKTKNFWFVHAGLRPPLPPEENDLHTLLWIRDEFIDSDYDWGATIVFGHTYVPVPLVQPNKVGIDTMARSRGYLSALILDDLEPDRREFIRA